MIEGLVGGLFLIILNRFEATGDFSKAKFINGGTDLSSSRPFRNEI